MSTAATFEYHTEIIGGQDVQKPLPKTLHAIVQARLSVPLVSLAQEKKSLDLKCEK
jgi:hypothetical protein